VPDIDLGAHERQQITKLRALLAGEVEGWPPLEGVTYESIELEGEFPYTEAVVIYREDYISHVTQGQRFRLYDDLGNLYGIEDAPNTILYSLGQISELGPGDLDANGIFWR
jgi:hypothetical protein